MWSRFSESISLDAQKKSKVISEYIIVIMQWFWSYVTRNCIHSTRNIFLSTTREKNSSTSLCRDSSHILHAAPLCRHNVSDSSSTRSFPISDMSRVLFSWLGKWNQNRVNIGVGGTISDWEQSCSQRHVLSNETTLMFRFHVVLEIFAQTWSMCKTYPTELCRHPDTSSPDIIFTSRRAWHLPRQDMNTRLLRIPLTLDAHPSRYLLPARFRTSQIPANDRKLTSPIPRIRSVLAPKSSMAH